MRSQLCIPYQRCRQVAANFTNFLAANFTNFRLCHAEMCLKEKMFSI